MWTSGPSRLRLCSSGTKGLGLALLFDLGVVFTACAQKAWSLVVAPQVHGTQHVFVGRELVSPRLLLRPTIGFAGTLGLRYGLSQQFSLEANIGPRSDGLKIASVSDYPGGRRFEAVEVSTIRFTSPQVYGGLLYRTLPSGKSVWVLETGVDVISRRYIAIGAFSATLSTNVGQPPATLSGTNNYSIDRSLLRFGIRVGIGREWQVGNAHFLGVKLLGSVGLQEFARWRIIYSFTDDGTSKIYQNTLHSKLGYVGLQTWYRLQW